MSQKETRGEIVESLEKVEHSGKWPKHKCAYADVDTLVGSSEDTRSGENGRRSVVLNGALQMAGMEELNEQCGKL